MRPWSRLALGDDGGGWRRRGRAQVAPSQRHRLDIVSTFYLPRSERSRACALPAAADLGILRPSPSHDAPDGMAAYDGPAWDEYIAQGAADGYQMGSTTTAPRHDNMELKAQLDEIEESFRTCDAQLEANVNRLGRIVDSWSHGRLTEEQEEHVLRAALPRLLAMVLRIRVTHAVLADRISRFLQHVLGVVAESLRNDESVIAAEFASRILTDAHHFLFYDAPFAPRSPSGDLDSQSSGAESGDDSDGMAAMMDGGGAPGGAHHGHYGEDVVSDRLGDDRSPRYLQNVEAFHNNGGFDACVERLAARRCRSAMRCCLRPLLKCAPVLRRSVLGRWAHRPPRSPSPPSPGCPTSRSRARTAARSPRWCGCSSRSSTRRASPDAASLLNRFQLTLAHKCLRTPYLEKRLIGLSAPPPAAAAAAPAPTPARAPPLLLTPAPAPAAADDIKEMINLTIRRHEYAAASTGDAARAQHGGRGGWESRLFPSKGWPTAGRRPRRFVEWLQREKTVELIFGEGLHAQVVSRCVELLGFLAMQARSMVAHRADLARLARQARECEAADLPDARRPHRPPAARAPSPALPHIKSVLAEYTKDVLALLRGFAIGAAQSQAVAGVVPSPGEGYGLEELWGLSDGSLLGDELRASAEAALGEILTWIHGASHRGPYLQRCLRQLEAGTSVPRASASRGGSSPPSRRSRRARRDRPRRSRRRSSSSPATTTRPPCCSPTSQGTMSAPPRASPRAAAASKAKSRRAAEAAAAATEREHLDELQERLDFTFCLVNAPLAHERARRRAVGHLRRQPVLRVAARFGVPVARAHTSPFYRRARRRGDAPALRARSASSSAATTDGVRIDRVPVQVAQLVGESAARHRQLLVVHRLRAAALRDRHALAARPPRRRRRRRPPRRRHAHAAPPFPRARPRRRARSSAPRLRRPMHALARRRRQPPPRARPAAAAAAGGGATAGGAEGERAELELCVERCLTLRRVFVEEAEAKLVADGAAAPSRRHGMAVRGVPVRVTVTLVGGSNSPRLDVLIDSKATVGALRAQIWKALARHGEWQPGHPRDLRMITAGRELKDG